VLVIVVRHAKAQDGQPDALRPLTDAGEAAAKQLGVTLAARGPQVVVASPLLRAKQTATAISEACGVDLVIDDRLAPGATADDLREVVAGRGETVVTVGHQPDCSEIVFALTGRSVDFPAGGFAEVEV